MFRRMVFLGATSASSESVVSVASFSRPFCAVVCCVAAAAACQAAERRASGPVEEVRVGRTYPADHPAVELAFKLQKASVCFYYREASVPTDRTAPAKPSSSYAWFKGPAEDGQYRFTYPSEAIRGFRIMGGSDTKGILTEEIIADMAALFANVEVLDISNNKATLIWARQLAAFSALRKLNIRLPLVKSKVTSDEVPWTVDDRKKVCEAVFEGITHLTSLEKLDLVYFNLRDGDIARLAGVRGLRELTLSYPNRKYYDDTNYYIAPVHEFKAETLIASVTEMKELRVLNTEGIRLEGQIDWKTLGGLPSLETFQIAWSGIDDGRLAGVEHLKQLKTLDVSYSEITGKSLDSMARISTLETINVAATQVAGNILALAELPNLAEVDFPRDSLQEYRLTGPEIEFFARCCKSGDRAWVEDPKAVPISRINGLVPGGITSMGIRHREQGSEIRLSYQVPKPANNPQSTSFTLARNLTDRDFEDIESLTEVTYVGVQSDLTDNRIARLAALKKLKTLHLQLGRPVTAAVLSGLAGKPSLESLRLYDVQLNEAAMAHIASMPALNSLHLERGDIESGDLRPLSRAASLKSLWLQKVSVDGPAGARLRDIKDIPSLETFSIGPFNGDDAECRWIGRSPTLAKLFFKGTFSDVGLTRLAGMTNLEELYLEGNLTISEEDLRVLGQCPRLRWATINNSGHKPGHTKNIYSESLPREFEIGFAGACSCGCMDEEAPKATVVSKNDFKIQDDTLTLDDNFRHSLDRTDRGIYWNGKLRIYVPIERDFLRIVRSHLPKRLESLYLNNCKVKRLELVDCYQNDIGIFGNSEVDEVYFTESAEEAEEAEENTPQRRYKSVAFYFGNVEELTIESAPSLSSLSLYDCRNLRSVRFLGDFPELESLYVKAAPELTHLSAPYSGDAPLLRIGSHQSVREQLARLPSLRLLKMPGTALGNFASRTSRGDVSGPLPPLHEVDVRRTQIDDQWLESLAEVPSLRILRVAGCENLTDEAVAAFRKARPDVELVDE